MIFRSDNARCHLRCALPESRAPAEKIWSTPSQASVIRQAAAPDASKTRVGGENPVRAIDSRLMFNTMTPKS